MARLTSLPADLIHRAKPSRAAGEPKPRLHAQWRTASGEPLGPATDLGVVDDDVLEHPGENGSYMRTRVSRPPVLRGEPPEGAHQLHLSFAAVAMAPIAAHALAQSPDQLGPPTQRQLLGPADAHMVLPVVAERFDQWPDFLATGQALFDWIQTQPPFDGLPGAMALDLLFWPSDPDHGLFQTDDGKCQPNRLFYGDRVLARELLHPYLGASPVSVILINSTLRGGAGGQPGYSAWVSIAAAPGEAWQAVALHEVGHGFGLGDEYVDAIHAGDPVPDPLEPNISDSPDPTEAPWSTQVSLPATPAPSGDLVATGPAGIGTFQGARYRTDFYRATANCLMRSTGGQFCPVCQEHIRSRTG
jgi:hypothetical protein